MQAARSIRKNDGNEGSGVASCLVVNKEDKYYDGNEGSGLGHLGVGLMWMSKIKAPA